MLCYQICKEKSSSDQLKCWCSFHVCRSLNYSTVEITSRSGIICQGCKSKNWLFQLVIITPRGTPIQKKGLPRWWIAQTWVHQGHTWVMDQEDDLTYISIAVAQRGQASDLACNNFLSLLPFLIFEQWILDYIYANPGPYQPPFKWIRLT